MKATTGRTARADFDGRPFVAGSLIGVRAFDVDKQGRLSAVTRFHGFGPGENVAHCCIGGPFGNFMAHINRVMIAALRGEATPEAPEHQLAGIGCTCGFYAYFWGPNSFATEGTVTGLIEGYGVCTVGDRGFRAEKARLVALVDPASRWRIRRHWYRFCLGAHTLIGGKWRTWSRTWLVGLLVALAAGAFADLGNPKTWPLEAIVLFGWALMFVRKPPDTWQIDQTIDFRAVRDLYDVPAYPTLRAALKAHPTTPPAGSRRPRFHGLRKFRDAFVGIWRNLRAGLTRMRAGWPKAGDAS